MRTHTASRLAARQDRYKSCRAVFRFGCNFELKPAAAAGGGGVRYQVGGPAGGGAPTEKGAGDKVKATWYVTQLGAVTRGRDCEIDPGDAPLLQSVLIHSAQAKKKELENAAIPEPTDAQLGYTSSRTADDYRDLRAAYITLVWRGDLGMAPTQIRVIAPSGADGVSFCHFVGISLPTGHARA